MLVPGRPCPALIQQVYSQPYDASRGIYSYSHALRGALCHSTSQKCSCNASRNLSYTSPQAPPLAIMLSLPDAAPNVPKLRLEPLLTREAFLLLRTLSLAQLLAGRLTLVLESRRKRTGDL